MKPTYIILILFLLTALSGRMFFRYSREYPDVKITEPDRWIFGLEEGGGISGEKKNDTFTSGIKRLFTGNSFVIDPGKKLILSSRIVQDLDLVKSIRISVSGEDDGTLLKHLVIRSGFLIKENGGEKSADPVFSDNGNGICISVKNDACKTMTRRVWESGPYDDAERIFLEISNENQEKKIAFEIGNIRYD